MATKLSAAWKPPICLVVCRSGFAVAAEAVDQSSSVFPAEGMNLVAGTELCPRLVLGPALRAPGLPCTNRGVPGLSEVPAILSKENPVLPLC